MEITLSSFGNFSWDIPHESIYQSWYLTPCCVVEVQNPSQALKSVKGPDNTFDLNTKWERTLSSFGNILWDSYSPRLKSKYQRWYLTPCCGLEMQNPTQAHKSVKGWGNTFDLNSKWKRTFPSFDNFSWDVYSSPTPNRNIKVDIWHPVVGLRCRIPPRQFSQLKAREISLL